MRKLANQRQRWNRPRCLEHRSLSPAGTAQSPLARAAAAARGARAEPRGAAAPAAPGPAGPTPEPLGRGNRPPLPPPLANGGAGRLTLPSHGTAAPAPRSCPGRPAPPAAAGPCPPAGGRAQRGTLRWKPSPSLVRHLPHGPGPPCAAAAAATLAGSRRIPLPPGYARPDAQLRGGRALPARSATGNPPPSSVPAPGLAIG